MTGMTNMRMTNEENAYTKSNEIQHKTIHTIMKRQLRLVMVLVTLFTMVSVLPVSGQAPPPPAHGQNGNQTSPGGATGCPLDRRQGIVLAMVLSLGYAGFTLYLRNKKEKEA